MANKIFRLSPNGQFDFSLEFENVIFATVPTSCALLAVILDGVCRMPWRHGRGQRPLLRAAIQYMTVLAILTVLHAISLASYYRHSDASALHSATGAAAYVLRLIASFLVFLSSIPPLTSSELRTDIYLLATCVPDGFRLHTLWVMARQPGEPIGIALPALQAAVVAVSGAALILFEVFSNFKARASRKQAGLVHVDEPGSGIFSMLFFGWLWPLLRYGHKNTITTSDLESVIARSTATFKLGSDCMSTIEDERKFISGIALPFLGAVIIQILSARATLAQPFIVQGIVSYLQSEQKNQLNALRSLGGLPPTGGWNVVSDRVVVHVSQVSVAIAGAVQLLGMIIPNIFLLPTLLTGPLSRSEHRLLQATEHRIASVKHLISEVRSLRFSNMQHTIESQATDNRRQEIEAAATFRRILTMVIVAAVFLSSLATLAAFSGFSLLPRHSLDNGVLFTSLSTMQIMLTPLLSIIQMLPEFVSSLVSWKRLVSYIKINEEDLPSSKSPQSLSFISEKSASPHDTLIEMVNLTAKTGDTLLVMEDVTAEWASGSVFIENASLSLGMGCMAIVTGAAGSGKSSFLKAILRENTVVKGRLTIGAHKLSLCDQMLWFFPEMSIKENIVFGKPFDQCLYNKVIACCCLDRDLRVLDDGDGMRLSITGSPLSSGQQHQVSLAQTLYDSGDLFLFDDIFTKLDAKTRVKVVMNVFGTNGFIQKANTAAILVCTEPPGIISSFVRTEFYTIQNSRLNVVEKSAFVENEIQDARHQSSKSTKTATITEVSSSDNVERRQSTLTEEEEAVVDHFSLRERSKTWEAHCIYFKSLGSPIIVAIAGVFLFAWAGIDRAGYFWLTHWASRYSNLNHDIENSYYIGIYIAFSVASVLAIFISVWYAWMFTNDIESVDLHLPQSLQNLIAAIASCIGPIVSSYLSPMIFILQNFYLKTSFQLRSLQVEAQAPMLQMVSAILEGRVTIRAFNQNQYRARLMSDCINRALIMGYLFKSVQIWITLMLCFLNGCLASALASLLIGLGGSNSVTWGCLALVNIIRLGQDAMLLLMWWTRFETTMACMGRICDYTHRTPQEHVQIPEAPIDCIWPKHRRIQLKDLSLAHQSRCVIKDLSINIPAGTKVAILGRTGSGTLEVDSIDICSVRSDVVQSRLVGHSQRFVADSSATIRKNLDNKCNFSEGWQRIIGLSRTLLRDSTVYVMDEPTSGNISAMRAIFNILSNKTVINTTHTLVGITMFDQIIVIDDGCLVEQGSPAPLLTDESSMLSQLLHAE
ncbi:ABC multidrug transporter [Trichoderma evansii]